MALCDMILHLRFGSSSPTYGDTVRTIYNIRSNRVKTDAATHLVQDNPPSALQCKRE